MTPSSVGANARDGARHSCELVATGYAYPSDSVDNDEYFRRCAWPKESHRAALETETGVRSRLWCGPEETAWNLAERAVNMALSDSPALREEIDVVLVTSSTTTQVIRPIDPRDPGNPDFATLVVRALGRSGVLGLDLKSVNCAGFLRAMQVMDGMLANPAYRAGLVVSVERSSPFCTVPGNRSSFTFIFGDAAGAAVFRKRPAATGVGIVDYVGRTDAEKYDLIRWEPDGLHLSTAGASLKDAVVSLLVDCGRTLLERNRLRAGDVTWFLPLQSSIGVISLVAEQLGFPREKMLWFADKTGFSGSASIPSCLAEHRGKGTVRKGDLVLSVAVGAGLNAAAALYHA
jgi:3-oxoacyl-[acyl-carrier-protein] synthase III